MRIALAARRYQVFAGDVLCMIVGASIGRFCVVPENVPLAFTTKHIQALTLDSAEAEPHAILDRAFKGEL